MKTKCRTHSPFAHIDGHQAIGRNGNLLACYRIQLPEIYSLSETDFEELHTIWFQGLKSLSRGFVIHRQDIYQKRKYSACKLAGDSYLANATRRYFTGRGYLEHEAFLFFIWPKNRSFNQSKYMNPFRHVPSEDPVLLQEALEHFTRQVNDVVSYINSSRKIYLEPMKEEEVVQSATSFYNGFQKDVRTDILLNQDSIQIGNNYFDLLALNNEECLGDLVQTSKRNDKYTTDHFCFHQGFADGLGLELRENHVVNQILFLDDKYRWKHILEGRIAELKKSRKFGSQNRMLLEKLEHIEKAVNQEESSRLIRGHFNIIFWDKDKRRLAEIGSAIKTVFKELDILPYYPLGEERKHYFLNSYSCFASNFSNDDLYVADLKQALCFFINNTNYKSDPEGILFNDRFNVPVVRDVWDEDRIRIKARNFAIFSPTGEGKSFLANNILRQYFEKGVRLVIIDLGGSYSKFAKLYPQDHLILKYEQGKSLGINPFFIEKSGTPDPDQLEDLSSFLLELMGVKAEKSWEVSLKKILRCYYQEDLKNPSLESFYRFVEKDPQALLQKLHIAEASFSVSQFLHLVSEYVKKGLYSFLFEDRGDKSFRLEEKRLIIFELDEIRDNKEILSVMLKLIKLAIHRSVWQNKQEKGIILFDEFAKQLKFPNVLESVEYYYQAIRKQNGAIGVILQSINQLPDNSTAASILENTQVIFSLQNEKGYDQLHKRLHLSDHDLNQLRSVKNQLSGNRKYTEIFIKIGKESNIFRLEVPPEVFAAYLTEGPENQKILGYYEQTHCMEAAIEKYITKN